MTEGEEVNRTLLSPCMVAIVTSRTLNLSPIHRSEQGWEQKNVFLHNKNGERKYDVSPTRTPRLIQTFLNVHTHAHKHTHTHRNTCILSILCSLPVIHQPVLFSYSVKRVYASEQREICCISVAGAKARGQGPEATHTRKT